MDIHFHYHTDFQLWQIIDPKFIISTFNGFQCWNNTVLPNTLYLWLIALIFISLYTYILLDTDSVLTPLISVI